MRIVLALAPRQALAVGLGRRLPEVLVQLAGRRQQLLLVAWNEAGIQLGLGEGRVGDDPAQERQVGLQAADGELIEHAQQALASLFAVLAPGD